ncbi:MAG: DUF3372 domain-containing protein [Herpetosiphonaceae bacterium]|nr:DUF3372 domain-containing protein [Herpetosiphonaceae bacterium]
MLHPTSRPGHWLLIALLGLLSVSLWPAQVGVRAANSVTVTFNLEASTSWGEGIFVSGDQPELGSWSVANAIPLATGPYPRWYATISLPASTTLQYKYLKKDSAGNLVAWESFSGNRSLTTPASGSTTRSDLWGTPTAWSGARALWLDVATIAWNGTAGASYKLLSDPDGQIDLAAAPALTLTASGTVNAADYPKNPNAGGLTRLKLAAGNLGLVPNLLKGQVVVASYNGVGTLLDMAPLQIQGVLDALYAAAATPQALGLSYSGGVPTVRLWAPTAKSVQLRRYTTSSTASFTTHALSRDVASGVWSLGGMAGWDKQFYLFDVEVYVPAADAVVHNLVTDPYSVSLSRNSLRSQFVDLYNDATLKPAGWDSLSKPALAAPEDITIYEVHVRDWSLNDSTVPAAQRGTFKAFTAAGSDGMQHLLALHAAGLTHVHLMPAFDIASVNEDPAARREPDPALLATYAPDSSQQQATVALSRTIDGFNWGYDPLHYGAPEGSYATNPDGAARILEFREMVQSLNASGLRVVMDVVYNHTSAFGQDPQSVLDRVVPGYYHRFDRNGVLQMSSCCADTASEYALMEKLMTDTVVLWAKAYKVDGFRFDLMNLHTVANAVNVTNAVQALTVPADGVDGGAIYVYGEGWDFGSAQSKGLHYAKQINMRGTGIGTFNDRIRDAAHGGYSADPTQIRHQGFINGLSYDWNGYLYANRDQSDLWAEMGRLRIALAGSIADYTADPQESINYVSKHDNETLYDQNIFKLPAGATMAERVRVQNMGLSLVGLAQGIPFFDLGGDLLRSKSLDRNSYDSGDWFNRVDFTGSSNNFAVGLPPAWDNQSRWGIMGPLLANLALKPSSAAIAANRQHMREILRLRKSSKLFRLETAAAINSRVSITTPKDGLIALGLSDATGADLDPSYEYIMVLFNANKVPQTYQVGALAGMGFSLHPLQNDAVDADAVVKTASFNTTNGTFSIPARTTAVFVSTSAPPSLPSSIDWVGSMYPVGGYSGAQGIAQQRQEGDASGLNVYVQVYEPGVTPGAGQGAGIGCYLHWGRYGQEWVDLPMSYNGGFTGNINNDEYTANLPTASLAPGTYGFTTYCSEDGGFSKKWRVESPSDSGDGLLTITPNLAQDTVAPSPAGGVYVHLFEWMWSDIAKECTYLGAKGYKAVQVSPPMEHLLPSVQANNPWWVRYQPVSYRLNTSRSGTLAEFQSMVNTCNSHGVDIYVDAVINHMTGISGSNTATGTDGTLYSHYNYPGSFTQRDDFHACGTSGANLDDEHNIFDYSMRYQVQTCELLNLADLATGVADVRTTIHAYLQSLLDLGVKGFRVDAAKHIASQDLSAILDGLSPRPYIYQEVIDQNNPNEPIKSFEYTPSGNVTEFKYSVALGNAFNCGGDIASLQNLGTAMLPSAFAVVFTDNHDNQRGHGAGGACVVDYKDGAVYNLANIFALAHPFGYPQVMSSYAWTDENAGPPTVNGASGSAGATLNVYAAGQVAGDTPANCAASAWICEHRRTAIANMVQFRQVTAGQPLTGWATIAPNHIAFGRGSQGFVAINNTASPATTSYPTALAAGSYCNIVKHDVGSGQCVLPGTSTPVAASELIVVDASGMIGGQPLAAQEAFAIHVAAKLLPTTPQRAIYLPLIVR